MSLNTQAAFTSEGTYTPDALLAHNSANALAKGVTILTGQDLVRGSVLGKITLGTATSAAKSGGNTGNGTCTVDATTPVLANAAVGVYTVRCITAATNGGTFRVNAPDGTVLGDVAVAATFASQIKFVIADGATDFIVGDGFDITIAAGSGKYVLATAAAVNGSAVPDAILALDADATSADITNAQAYFSGTFNGAALTLGSGITLAAATEALRLKGINIVSVMAT